MSKRADQINPSDFFQDLALTLKSERSIGKVKNIVEFIDNELDQEKWGVKLCREQVLPLKVFYDIELEQEDRDILEQWKLDGKTTWEPLDNVNYQGLVIEGGRRSGKSTVSSLVIAYEFYKLVMEGSPQAKYGISRNSPISILAIATTATQTERTIFKQVRGVIPLIKSLRRMVEQGDIFIGKKAIAPVVRAEYSLNPLKAALEFEGKRLTPLNRFLNQELVRECFRGRSKVRYIDEDSEDKLVRKRVNKVDPSEYPSVAHIDPAIVRDSYALAIGHAEYDTYGQKLVVIDCMMAWHPQPGSQVSVTNVQEAILDINKKRFIQKLTSDHHQNTETIQRLQTMGINAEGKFFGNKYQLMIYEQLRFIINEGRLILPKDSPVKDLARDELNQLEITNGTKIDHPQGGCFVGDTRIPLLDGTRPMISELEGKEVYVYSCKPNGEVIPGKAKGRLTKYTKDLVDIILDNGSVVRCTPDHPFMMRNGEYIQARDIIPGLTRLMPINFQWPVNGGYERISTLNYPKWLTHHMSLG